MGHRVSITSAPVSPEADRNRRFRTYTLMMAIRFACFILMIVLPDWWKLLAAVGAVALPYFAVVVANAVRSARPTGPETPLLALPATDE